MLDQEFRDLYESNDVLKMETKIRNIRFLCELSKFGICPVQTILEYYKMCLDNFQGHNIDIITQILECAGKFLGRVEESKLKFNNLLNHL